MLWHLLQTIVNICAASSLCSNTNECDQTCVLLDGVEQCSCDRGYSLTEDGLTCQGLLDHNIIIRIFYVFSIDVNECQEEGACSQLCNNTVGGFECGCRAGFKLGLDERSCEGMLLNGPYFTPCFTFR